MQSRMQKSSPEPAMLALEPFGRMEGNLCKMLPLRWRLMVICWDDMTRQRLPSGLGKTYLQVFCFQSLMPLLSVTHATRIQHDGLPGLVDSTQSTCIQIALHWQKISLPQVSCSCGGATTSG